jgi:hypothetical protein
MAATPASMLRIISQGLQDRERLNPPVGQPSTDFYTSVLRKRTRWASQWRRVEFDNLADFGRTATVTLPILGELITRCTLVVHLPNLFESQNRARLAGAVGPHWSWTNAVGHALCSQVDLQIGDQTIDRLDSRLLEILDEQTRPVEHFDSGNILIGRDPTAYTAEAYKGERPYQSRSQTVEVIFPFWWNRGPGPQALPIQALNKDRVQINCQFRNVQDLIYTDARNTDGTMPAIAGATFVDASGAVVPGQAMPRTYRFLDAYWIIEYVSLEDREAAAFRQADLQIPIEQHLAIPVQPTGGARIVRVPLDPGGLIRDITWVAQRVEASTYNAYFLFSRDLGPDASGRIPWWPDTEIPNWDYGDGFIRPGFSDRRSDPIVAATLWTRGMRRFEHEGPSLFRSLIPALGCQRTPLIDRYIYRYDFGFWPTGGLAETLDLPVDEIRGAANWDKVSPKELVVVMNQDSCDRSYWEVDTSQPARTYTSAAYLGTDFAPTTGGFLVELTGAQPDGSDTAGRGAIVRGTIDYQQIQRTPNFQDIYIRPIPNGSAGLTIRNTAGSHTWIAVAGGGGAGTDTGANRGGDAGSAVEISWQGGNALRTHAATATRGGGGGGRLAEADVGLGAQNGTPMGTTDAFVVSLQQTGGSGPGVQTGGDGWLGGGSGSQAGGGGGSYVSALISQVESFTAEETTVATVKLTPLRRVVSPHPEFNIYVWLTRYQMLRINSGRAALMFSA